MHVPSQYRPEFAAKSGTSGPGASAGQSPRVVPEVAIVGNTLPPRNLLRSLRAERSGMPSVPDIRSRPRILDHDVGLAVEQSALCVFEVGHVVQGKRGAGRPVGCGGRRVPSPSASGAHAARETVVSCAAWASAKTRGRRRMLEDRMAARILSKNGRGDMRSRGWKILLLLSGLLGLAFFSATAQVGDEDPCRSACRDAHSQCVTSCGAHSNPIECEAQCREQAQDCEERCS